MTNQRNRRKKRMSLAIVLIALGFVLLMSANNQNTLKDLNKENAVNLLVSSAQATAQDLVDRMTFKQSDWGHHIVEHPDKVMNTIAKQDGSTAKTSN